MDAFYGEIRLFPYNFIPANWVPCVGQPLSITQFSTLYAVIGTIYGGDGKTTFNVPNLNGSTVIGNGAGPGLTPRELGKPVGTTSKTLTTSNLPPHSHTITVKDGSEGAIQNTPAGNVFIQSPRTGRLFNLDPAQGYALAPSVVGITGQSSQVNNMQPYLTMLYCMCVDSAIYPARPS